MANDDMIVDYVNRANDATVLVRNNLEDKKAVNFVANGIKGIELVDSVVQSDKQDRYLKIDGLDMYYGGLPTERSKVKKYHTSDDKEFQDEVNDLNRAAKKIRSIEDLEKFMKMNGHKQVFGGKTFALNADALIVVKSSDNGEIDHIPTIMDMKAWCTVGNIDTLWAMDIIKLKFNLKNYFDGTGHARHDNYHSSFFEVDLHRLPSQFLIPHEKFGLKAPRTMIDVGLGVAA